MRKEKTRVEKAQEKIVQFRAKIYESFAACKDATLDLLDALCSNERANSAVELSLSPQFRRCHGSVYQAIGQSYGATEAERKEVIDKQKEAIGGLLPQPEEGKHILLVVDVTPRARPDGKTLTDRSYVYTPGGQMQAGHNYSVLGWVPQLPEPQSWCVPLSIERVGSEENKELFGLAQAISWAGDEKLPLHKHLVVVAGDKAYSSRACLYKGWQQENLLQLARLRNNQVLYHQVPVSGEKKAGHPRWYGQAFRLNKAETWSEPSETYSYDRLSPRGKVERIEAKAWSEMLLRGKRKAEYLPLHQCPFTLVQIITYRENGSQKYKNPLWLVAFGQRRSELSLPDIVHDYGQRPKIEHFNRFIKQDLLFNSFHTSDTQDEENWAHLVGLAYVQLYLAQALALVLPKPWQGHLPQFQDKGLVYTPAMVQRDFARIIRQIGSPAKAPKRRGYSPGRPKGSTKPPRPRPEVVRKGKKRKKRKK
jgi:hypothetical protein